MSEADSYSLVSDIQQVTKMFEEVKFSGTEVLAKVDELISIHQSSPAAVRELERLRRMVLEYSTLRNARGAHSTGAAQQRLAL